MTTAKDNSMVASATAHPGATNLDAPLSPKVRQVLSAPTTTPQGVQLTAIQAGELLGIGRSLLHNAMIKGVLKASAMRHDLKHGARSVRYHFNLSDVLALKAKLDKGEWSVNSLRRTGWSRRPTGAAATAQIKALTDQVADLHRAVSALVARSQNGDANSQR
jgi:hypothetical protein